MRDDHVKFMAAEIAARLHSLSSAKTPVVRNLRREYSKRLAHAGARPVLALALQLLRTPSDLHRFMAYELLNKHRVALASLRARDLQRLGRGLNSWSAVDTFACYLSGPAWREKQISDALVAKWACSKDRWWRRTALVSTVPLNRKALGGKGDAKRTLRTCRMLVHDRDDLVVKALSWALREVIQHNAIAVRTFIRVHKNDLAPRVLREVRNKLQTGLKNPAVGT